MKPTNQKPQTRSAAEALIEARRHTRDLSTREFNYLHDHTRLVVAGDRDLRDQCVTDAILYYMKPGNEVPDSDKGLTYYLTVKARAIHTDQYRAGQGLRRGEGKTTSFSATASLLGKHEGETALDSHPALGVNANLAGQEMDAATLMSNIYQVLKGFPDKLRILELRMEGYKHADIADMLGYDKPERVRKSIFDTHRLLLRTIPGLAQMRLEMAADVPTWDERRQRPSEQERGHLTSAECQRRALELEMA